MGKLFTVGYGGRQPSDFIKLLKDNNINVVIDVRREVSRAYLRPYWAGTEMEVTLANIGKNPIEYRHAYNLGNYYDTLDEYKQWLDSKEGQSAIGYEAEWIQKGYDYYHKGKDVSYCLLCCEKRAYVRGALGLPDDPIKVGCHRVYVADALVEILGDGWEVEHL